MSDPRIGQTLRHKNHTYKILSLVAQGGMGGVYRAKDSTRSDEVAIKVVPHGDAAPSSETLFESSILQRLNHENLPKVYDAFQDRDAHYLVMEYIPGQTLKQMVQGHEGSPRPLPPEQASNYVLGVLRVLKYLHSQGVIHRDVKPDNVKFHGAAGEGRPMLVDFGIAKIQDDENTRLAAKGLTAGYAPTEQYWGGTDARTDLFAAGALLYYLLTAHRPPDAVQRTSLPDIEWLDPRTIVPGVSPAIAAVVKTATALRKEQRYATADDMIAALRTALAGDSAYTPTPISFPTPLPVAPSTPAPARVSPLVISLGVVVLVVLLVAGLGASGVFAAVTGGPARENAVPTVQGAAVAEVPNSATPVLPTMTLDGVTLTPTDSLVLQPAANPSLVAISPTPALNVGGNPIAAATPTPVPPSPTLPPTATALPPTLVPTATPVVPTVTAVPPTLPPPTATVPPPVRPALSLLAPGTEASAGVNSQIQFSWAGGGTLQGSEYYDLLVWRDGTTPVSRAGPTTTSYTLNANLFTPGTYYWTVRVVADGGRTIVVPQALPRLLRIEEEGGGASVEDPNPTPDNPEPPSNPTPPPYP